MSITKLQQRYGLRTTPSGSLIWDAKALIQLYREQTKVSSFRGSYKKNEPYIVYTCKMPKEMVEWLRVNDGSSLIRRFIQIIMNSDVNSVLPTPIPSPKKTSETSETSQNQNTPIPTEQKCFRCGLPTTIENREVITVMYGLPLPQPIVAHKDCSQAEKNHSKKLIIPSNETTAIPYTPEELEQKRRRIAEGKP